MAIAVIANTAAGSTTGDNVTTGAINTTGANFLVLVVASLDNTGVTISDSKANTWTPRTNRVGTPDLQVYDANATGTAIVGTGHTFTATSTAQMPALAVIAFSGVATAAIFDVENGTSFAGVASVQPGSVTPTVNNEVLVTGLSNDVAQLGPTIDTGFTRSDFVDFVATLTNGVAMAYKIQTTAGAENPTWSWTFASNGAVSMATFKAAVAAAGTRQTPSLGLVGVQ